MATVAVPQEVPNVILSSELEQSEIPAIDFKETIKEALHFADLGCWEVRLKCPDNRTRSVRRIVQQFRLERLVNAEGA